MGTHPIFESDFDCLTEKQWLKKLKVVIVGDHESGKTLFTNIVSSSQSDVQPLAEFHRSTGNCRIVEFERAIDSQSVDVELWDISGDLAQESFWPVYADEMDGLILMTKDTVKHNFIDYFVESTQIQKEQSLLWVNGSSEMAKPPTIGFKVTNDVLSEPEKTRNKFGKFLTQLNQLAQSKQDRQERQMVN